MIGVDALGRRVYAEMSNDHGIESALRESLKARGPVLDEFDKLGYSVAFTVAWVLAKEEAPEASDGQLAETAEGAADLALRAQHTRGGWEAMSSGAQPEKSLTLVDWLRSIPIAAEAVG